MTALTLAGCAAFLASIACAFGFIDHARCEFEQAFQRAFNP